MGGLLTGKWAFTSTRLCLWQLKLIRAWAWWVQSWGGWWASPQCKCPWWPACFIQPLSSQAGAASLFVLPSGRAPVSQCRASRHQPARPQTLIDVCRQHLSILAGLMPYQRAKQVPLNQKLSAARVSTDKESFMEVTIAVHYHKHGFLLKVTCYTWTGRKCWRWQACETVANILRKK